MKGLKRAMAILLTFSMAISLFSGFVSASETLPRVVENNIETLSETAEDEIEALPEIVEGELETPSETTEDEPKTLPETTEEATDITSVNLALGKKTTASGESGFSKENAVDGDKATRWGHENPPNNTAWISVDLAAVCEIDKLEIDWEDNSAINIDFFVQFSMDNEIWSDPVTGQKIGSVSAHTISVLEDTITARYVKVTGKVTLGYNAVSICELEIWGVRTDIPLPPEPEQSLNLDAANLARGKTATAYKSPIDYWGPDKLTDGIINRTANKPEQSRWSSEAGAPGWVIIDLKKPQTFDRLTLEWEQPVVEDYRIEVSDDNNKWTTVYIADTNAEGYPFTDNVILEEAVTAQYVKLSIDKLKQGAYPSISLYEIQIWAPDASNINKAIGKSASASQDDGIHKPALAVDGVINREAVSNEQSRWASEPQGAGAWFKVDLEVPLEFNRIKIDWETLDITTDFHIDVSNDNSIWETVYTADSRDYALQEEFNLDAMCSARYVKLVADRVNGYPSVSFYEFGLYQDLDYVSAIDRVKKMLEDTTLTPDDIKLPMPGDLPAGVTLAYGGTDYKQIIDADRNIHKPLVDTEVAVEFKIKMVGQETELAEINLIVPGKYDIAQSNNNKPEVLPELQQWFGREGDFIIGIESKIILDPALGQEYHDMALAFAADYEEITGNTISVVSGINPAAGDFYFKESTEELDKETYDMEIEDYITVSASHNIGAFWSTRTILQILKINGTTIPKGLIRDYPKFEVRGFMLDVGRKAITLDFIKMWVKQMSWYKLNDFNLHLSDETFDHSYAGFRLESNVPNLTNTDIFYTKEEFRQLQIDSKAQGVNIVPEFDTPGHALAYTRARPDLARPGNSGYLDVQNPDSLIFIKELFEEYMEDDNPVFLQDTVVHIGTDEYKGGSQQEKEAFRTYQDALLKFIRDDMHRTPRVWGSQTENSGTTPITVEGVQMYMWYPGYSNPKEMYDLGYEMINIHDGNVYIVPGAGYYNDYLNKNNILNTWKPNDVMGLKLPAGDPQVLGGSYALWNDRTGYGTTNNNEPWDNGTSDVELLDRMFHILPTFSERLWSNCKDYTAAEIDALTAKVKYAPGTNPTYEVKTEDKVVLSYNFNEGKETADASVNGYELREDTVNIDFILGRKDQALQLKGGESYVETPVDNMRINATLDFWVKREADDDDTEKILFESETGEIKAVQKVTGKVGFSRDFRDYSFNYTLPKDEWIRLTMVTEYTKTTLYVNGTFIQTLESTVSGGNKWASLIIPLSRIGSKNNAFKGEIDSIALYDFAATEEQINNLPHPELRYMLNYENNGGIGGPESVSNLKVTNGYILNSLDVPTHAKVNSTDVVFIGWSVTKDNKIYGKADTLPETLIVTKVDISGDTIVYAVWGYDENRNGVPDIYEAQYTLRYDANGGTGTPDQETGILAQNQYILNVAIRPTHTQVNGANVVFLGWSLVKDGTIYNKTDTLPAGLIIKSVAVQDNTTVYAVWGYDSGAGSGNHTSGRAIAASAKGTTNITDDTVPLAEWKPEESRQLETDIRIAYLSGYTDGTVRPDNAITRSEAASIFYRLLKHKGMAAGGRFSDVLDNAWYTKEVNYLASLGILTGYPDGTFNPDAHITRGEFAAIVSHFNNIDSTDSNPFSDVDSGHWAFTNVSSAHAKGWINGYPDGTFRPGNSITRAEAVTIVNAVLSRKSGSSTLAKDINPYNDLNSDHWAYAGIIEASVTND